MFAIRTTVRALFTGTLVASAALFGAAPAAYADEVEIQDNHIKVGGIKYYRANAENVVVGSTGRKREPITSANFIEVHDHIPQSKLAIKNATTVAINFKQSAEKDVMAGVNKPGVFKGHEQTAYADLKSGKLKLVKFTVELSDLESAANNAPKVLDGLWEFNTDARIVSDIWVVLEAKTAEAISSSSKLTLSVKAEGVQITAAVGTNGKDATTVVVSKGTVYAYMLAKPDWDGNPKKEKAKIKSLKLDQWGL